MALAIENISQKAVLGGITLTNYRIKQKYRHLEKFVIFLSLIHLTLKGIDYASKKKEDRNKETSS